MFLMDRDTLPSVEWKFREVIIVGNQLIDTDLEHPKSCGEATIGKTPEILNLHPLPVLFQGDAVIEFLAFDIVQYYFTFVL